MYVFAGLSHALNSYPILESSSSSGTTSTGSCCSISSSQSSAAQQTMAASKQKRFRASKSHPAAATLQTFLYEGCHKYHESPQRVCAKDRQTRARQLGTVNMCVVIGASKVGKCAGFSPYLDAQVQAVEHLLEHQNPARFARLLQQHRCTSEEQQVQQLVSSKAPELQPHLDRAAQLGKFENCPDPLQSRQGTAGDVAAGLAKHQAEAAAAAQQAVAKALATAAAVQQAKAQELAAAAAAQQAKAQELAAAAAAVQQAKAQELATAAAAQLAEATQLAAAAQEATKLSAAACKVEQLQSTAASTTAAAIITVPAPVPDLAACSSPSAYEAASSRSSVLHTVSDSASSVSEPSVTARSSHVSTDSTVHEDDSAVADCEKPQSRLHGLTESQADAVELLPPFIASHVYVDAEAAGPTASTVCSDPSCSSESVTSDTVVMLTEQEVQKVREFCQQQCYTAYGMHAERLTFRELEMSADAANGDVSWHKMGAPDHQALGSYRGIEFELSCQIDKARVQGGQAIPTEVKNRANHFMSRHDNCPASLPQHELVQVQCQLQLTGAPHGILLERLDRGGGQVDSRMHLVERDDWWWSQQLLPALHAFLRVFANLATYDDHLNEYLVARKNGRHQELLQKLVWQQFWY